MAKHTIFLLFAILLLILACSGVKKKNITIAEIPYPADLHIVTRAEWGWKPLTHTVAEHEISKITIHHGGVDTSPEKEPIEYLRNLQDWSRSEKKWIDNPYHFMIDLQGRIYEARPINYPGDTNTTYNPRGHALICVIGNYENQTVSRDQLDALIRLATFLAKYFAVPLDSIAGHKDYAETDCPGKDLYRYLQDGTIRNGVAKLIGKN